MIVWIVNHYAVSPGSSGGTRHYDLARELTKAGCRVTVLASSFEHQERLDPHLTEPGVRMKTEEIGGVRFAWLHTRAYVKNDWRRVVGMAEFALRAYRFCRKDAESPDVVIGSLMHPFAALAGWFMARKKMALFYFEERDLWPQTLLDFGKVSKYHPVVLILSALELFLYRKAQRIVVLFDKAVHYVTGRGIEEAKIVYLPNGVDLDRYKGDDTELPDHVADNVPRGTDTFLAVYTGSHGITDHLEGLLQTASLLQQRSDRYRFLFVGNGPDKERLTALKAEWGLDNVTFLPPIAKTWIPGLLRRADVGLISLKDASVYKWGMSFNKLYDYMAAGLPTMLLGKPESNLERSQAGLIGGTPEELADLIVRVAENPSLRAALADNAKGYVAEFHSWERLSGRLLDAVREDLTRYAKARIGIHKGRGWWGWMNVRETVSGRSGFGHNVIVGEGVVLGRDVSVGHHVIIGRGVTLGNHVSIGHNVIIYDGSIIGDHTVIMDNAVVGKQPRKAQNSVLKQSEGLEQAVVGSECTIGTSAIVYAGCTLGDGVFVADLATVRERVNIGSHTIVGRGVSVENDCSIGTKCKLETNCYITAYSTIGNYVFVAPGVVTSNDNYMGRTEERFAEMKGVTVRDGGRIGANATTLPGVVIEEDGSVGAGSVVTKDVRSAELVAGVPARKLRVVPETHLLRNQSYYV